MEEESKKNKMKIALGLFLSVFFVFLNGFLTLIDLLLEERVCQSSSWVTGYLMGGALSIPVIAVLIGIIFKRNRNKKTLIKIFLWASVIIFFSKALILVNNIVNTLPESSN